MEKLTTKTCDSLIGTENAGYQILYADIKHQTKIYGIVLAKIINKNDSEKDFFTTWQFHIENGIVSYYWGNYFSTFKDTVTNFIKRCEKYNDGGKI